MKNIEHNSMVMKENSDGKSLLGFEHERSHLDP